LRSPKEANSRAIAYDLITNDFTNSGAIDSGLVFRIRTVHEQAIFQNRLVEEGIIPEEYRYIVYSDHSMVLPFIEGELLNEYLLRTQNEQDLQLVINNTFRGLKEAHSKQIVLGDRLVPNTIVLPDLRVVEFDFDVEIIGDVKIAAAFEIAQAVYHIIHFSSLYNRRIVSDAIVTQLENCENKSEIFKFIGNFVSFYRAPFESNGVLLENIEPPPIDAFSEIIK
jgi:hypothetical protein